MQENQTQLDQVIQDVCELKAQQACLAVHLEQESKSQSEPLVMLSQELSQTKTRLSRLEAHKNRSGYSGIGAAEEAPLKESFEQFVRKGGTEKTFEVKELSTDQTEGVVSTYVSEKIIHHLNQMSPLRTLASIMEIEGDGAEILLDEGGAEAGWVGEKGPRAETVLGSLHKLTIPTHELYARPMITQRLLDDARLDLESWIVEKITDKMVAMENQAFLMGDGVKKPKGILHYPAVASPQEKKQFQAITIKPEVYGKASALVAALMDTLYALSPAYLQGAVWMMSRQMLAVVRKLKDEATGHFLWQPSLAAEGPASLLGYPVVVIDDMPPLDGKGLGTVAIFGNLKQAYQVVDRTSLSILRDPYSSKPNVEFYVTRRVGGDVVNFHALKFLKVS